MNTQTKTEPLRIRLENVRLSWPHLDAPSSIKQADGSASKPKFQATFILDKKEHKATIEKLKKLIDRAQIEKFGRVVKLKNCCLQEGADKVDKNGDFFDGYSEDVMSIIAKSDNRPAVVDGQKNTVQKGDAKWPEGGDYVNASIDIFAYKHAVGGMGVSASLRAVQYNREGVKFSGSNVDLDEEFETVSDGAEFE